jgi:PAS domain S-box-containing protein
MPPCPAAPPDKRTNLMDTPPLHPGPPDLPLYRDRPLILVVDDIATNLELMSVVLRSVGYDVVTAADGQQAVDMMPQCRPDLILLDVMMPGMDGYETCRQIKAIKTVRDIPVIFVTALSDPHDEALGFTVGAVDYIQKPISVPLVLARVKLHLAQNEQRRNLEGMFKDVVEFAPDAFILTDGDGKIVRVNARTEQLFGYRRQELLGQAVELLLPQRLRDGHVQHRQGYTRDPKSLRMGTGIACRRKDGSEFPGDINLSPLQTTRGQLYMAVVRDMSERKQQEDQLLEAARYARSLLESSLDPMAMIDRSGRLVDFNSATERITGLSREQLAGSDAASKFTHPEELYRGFQLVLAQGQVLDFPMAIRHASGKVIDVLCNASLYRNAQGEVIGVFTSARDVTESRRIQQEVHTSRQHLRELAAQLETAREEERKHIAREVHDELGQVLTALRMDVSLLRLRFGALDPQLAGKVQDMKHLVDRGIQGVRNVATNLRPAALDMGLIAALEWLCNESSSRTDIPCILRMNQDEFDLDEARAVVVFRIVQESITNIARYAQATQINIDLAQNGDELRVTVQDDGQGFDPAQAAGKKSFGLLGMRERALALGGRLDIQSAPQQGATIALTIPLHTQPTQEAS